MVAILLLIAVRTYGSPADDYFCRVWRIEDGLTDNSVNAVAQDPRGYIWMATLFGLTRFDGRRFEEVPLPWLAKSGENLRALAWESPDTLLMLPASGGVVRFRQGQFSRHPVDASVRDRTLRQLFVTSDGALWMGEMRGEILRWQDGRLTTFGSKNAVSSAQGGFSVAEDGQGGTWVAEGEFLGRYANGHLVPYPDPIGSDLVIAPARAGGIWISTATRLLRLRDGRITAQASAPVWTSTRDAYQCLFEDSQDVLWIGTRRKGLLRFANGVLQPVSTQQQVIAGIMEDSEHGIWVASKGGGAARLQRKRFLLVRPQGDQTDAASTALIEDAAGTIWCANRDGGVFRYRDGLVEPVQNPSSDPHFYANTICADGRGTIWVGANSGLYRVEMGDQPSLRPAGPALQDVHVLYLSLEGDLWYTGGYDRLGRLHQGVFQELTSSDGFPGKQVEAIAETLDHTLWMAIAGNLYAYRGGRLEQESAYARPSTLNRIYDLHGDANGALWIGTHRGLLRLKGGRIVLLNRSNGLPDERIEQIQEDGRGAFWLNTRQGFFRVARTELDAAADGTRGQVSAVTFGSEQGLASEIPVTNCQPNSWLGSEGRLWFCTQQGAVGIEVGAVPDNLSPPPIYLDQALVDGQVMDPARLRVPNGGHQLGLRFSSPSFAAPEKIHLRYRITGFDHGWNETTSGQAVSYSGLPVGRYLIQAAASDPNGIWHDGVGLALPLFVTPLWWETLWARLLGLGLFAAGIAWLARYLSVRLLQRRLKQIEREHALEKERARIARDLHDELGASLTQISLVVDRLRRRAPRPELVGGLGQLTRHTQRLAADLESIIWTVHPQNNSLDQLGSFVHRFALHFFQDTPIACSVLGADELPSIEVTPEIQHHLLSAIKEVLNNALKYSQANSITVELRYAAGQFHIRIRDDGVGFEIEAARHSKRNGLSNLRSRVREIRGAIAVVSAPGQGTEISWSVPIAPVPATANPGPSLS